MVTVGFGGCGATTATRAELCAEPPGPAQVNVKSVAAVNGPVLRDPLVGVTAPCQPPEAVQDLAAVALQVSVAAAPGETCVGSTVSETDGATGVPPEPPPHAASATKDNAVNARRMFIAPPRR